MSSPAPTTTVKTPTREMDISSVTKCMAAQKDVASADALQVIPVGAMSQVSECPASETIVERRWQQESAYLNDISDLDLAMHHKTLGRSQRQIR